MCVEGASSEGAGGEEGAPGGARAAMGGFVCTDTSVHYVLCKQQLFS